MKNHRFLSLSTVKRYEALARERKVSEVARGRGGFLPAYKRAGSATALPEGWQRKREAFIARKCNIGIGQFDESASNLRAAIEYLDKFERLFKSPTENP